MAKLDPKKEEGNTVKELKLVTSNEVCIMWKNRNLSKQFFL